MRLGWRREALATALQAEKLVLDRLQAIRAVPYFRWAVQCADEWRFAEAYPFTYDLSDLARYYVAWDRLMRHWEEVIGEWLSVSCEELVASQERVSRKIVMHCGLDWQEGCLNFHSNSAAVSTASAPQVRRPLYSDSVGKWRRYPDPLEPLARGLEANGIPVR
jgi:hypothetical protein